MAESRRSRVAVLVALLAVTAWTYWGALRNPFHFDDALFLQSPQIAVPGDPWYLLKPAQARQLTNLTFYWNYRIGAMAPAGYHLVNWLLHLANVLAVYFFARLLILRKPEFFDSWMQQWLPAAAAGIFALHPVQTESVNYAYQRSTLLAAFFALLSMNSFLQAQRSPRRKIWLALSACFFFMAAVSKESAWVLPLMWAALVWGESEDFRSFRRSLLRLRWFAVFLVLAALGALWTLYSLWSRGERNAGLALMDGSFNYLLAQIQVLATYLRLILIPTGLSIDYDFHPFPALSPYGIFCLLLLAALLALAALVRGRSPFISFLILAFFIFLVPTSSIIPSNDLLFIHRLYLPMIAAASLMAWAILFAVSWVVGAARPRAAVAALAVCLTLGCFAVVSKTRTRVWGDNILLWQDAVAKAPGKARTHYNLGVACLETDRERARRELLKTVELDPKHAAALYNLGWIAQVEADYDSARRYYRSAIQADPGTWQAHHNLGNLCILQGDLQGGAREFEETIRLRADYWPAYLNLAGIQLQIGDTAAALRTIQNLKQIRWDLLEARYLSALALVQEARYGEADGELRFISEHDAGGAYRDRIEALRGRFPARPGASK